MTNKQKKFLGQLQNAVAKLNHDGDVGVAERLGPIVEAITNEDYILAVIVAKILGLPNKLVTEIETTFKTRRVD